MQFLERKHSVEGVLLTVSEADSAHEGEHGSMQADEELEVRVLS